MRQVVHLLPHIARLRLGLPPFTVVFWRVLRRFKIVHQVIIVLLQVVFIHHVVVRGAVVVVLIISIPVLIVVVLGIVVIKIQVLHLLLGDVGLPLLDLLLLTEPVLFLFLLLLWTDGFVKEVEVKILI